jgi:APA family basic amino acid/polyamine antiporter
LIFIREKIGVRHGVRHIRKKIGLKRELGMWEAMLTGVGIILGAGIYVLVGKAAGIAGNNIWLSFFIGAVVAALTGLSYAELSSVFPKAGAEFVYAKKAFTRRIGFMTGWMVTVSGLFAGASVALGFSGYFSELFSTPVILTSIVLLMVLAFILFYGIKQSAWVGIIFTLIEGGGLILIILISLPYWGSVDLLDFSGGFSGIMPAAALIFFAFLGFEEIVRLSEETKEPKKNIPRALILAIIISTILYVLVAISAVSVVDWHALSESNAPLADVASVALGLNAFVILAVIALFSTSNTVLLEMLATSRMIYGMADFKSLPKAFAKIHKKRRTPWVAIFITAVFTIIFVSIKEIEIAASITDFTIFATFIVINLAVIALRYKMPNVKRTFKIPLNIGKFPVLSLLGAITSFLMIMSLNYEIMIYGVFVILIGIVIFEIMDYRKIIAKK